MLAPTQDSLTELTLHSDTYVGVLFGLPFASLYFPHLRGLSLGKFVFEPSLGAEKFILRHATTLARLELLECKLPIDSDTFDPPPTALANDVESIPMSKSWAVIWGRFAAELTALLALHISWGVSGRYVRLVETMFYREVYVREPLNVADDTAIARFHIPVAARSKAVCGEF